MELYSHATPDTQTLAVKGRFDAHGAPEVQAWFDQQLAGGPANVVIDLGGVNFIDSTGLATLVQGMKRARQVQGDLRLCNMQPPVRTIFELVRLDAVFYIFADEAQATRSFVN